MPFPHRTALITGASSGIGRATAQRLVENNVFVIVVARRRHRLDGLIAQHGTDYCAAEVFDVTDLDAIPDWALKYPSLSCIILNAGIQHTLDFTSPSYHEICSKIVSELTTNYTSPVLTATAFIAHLTLQRPASIIIFITSALSLVPLPLAANYSASKSALHSLIWSLRSQLAYAPTTSHIRVVEVLPPAVQTELHDLQPELVAAGKHVIGIPLADYLDDAWESLDQWDAQEAEVFARGDKARAYEHINDARKEVTDTM